MIMQALPYARACFKFTGWFDKKAADYLEQLMPAGYKPVEVDWKHADRCGVCGLDEVKLLHITSQRFPPA